MVERERGVGLDHAHILNGVAFETREETRKRSQRSLNSEELALRRMPCQIGQESAVPEPDLDIESTVEPENRSAVEWPVKLHPVDGVSIEGLAQGNHGEHPNRLSLLRASEGYVIGKSVSTQR